MYERPENAAAHDRFWSLIRARLGKGPKRLSRPCCGAGWSVWESPDLFLGQTCGLPYRTRLHGKVRLVGTLDHGLPHCPAGHYYSVIVVPRARAQEMLGDVRSLRLAFNARISQSGWAAPVAWLQARGLVVSSTHETGSHRLSARAVAQGCADVAGLDALSWALMQRFDDVTDDLAVIAHTPPTPGLPCITAAHQDPAPLFDAMQHAIEALCAEDRALLHLRGLVHISAAEYLAVADPPIIQSAG